MRETELDIRKQHIIAKRMFVTVCITIVFIAITKIPLPFLDNALLLKTMQHHSNQLTQMLSIVAGGNIQEGSIFLVGLTPYITVQLIFQFLQLGISPRLKAISEGPNGQQKIAKMMKFVTAPLTLVFAGETLLLLEKLTHNQLLVVHGYPVWLIGLLLMLIITASTLTVVWLSDLNTLYGLGNGINYLISCSIIVGILETTKFKGSILRGWSHILGSKLIPVMFIVLVVFLLYNTICIWYQSSTFQLKMQFAKLDSSIDTSGNLPLSLNIANVMPVVLTGMLIQVINLFVMMYCKKLAVLVNFKSWASIGFYTIMLIIFTYIFTFCTFYPKNLTEKIERMNAYILGVDPTISTVHLFWQALSFLATLNVLFFMVMVIIPMILLKLAGLSESMVMGISSVLIVVTTEADIRRQIAGLRAKQLPNGIIS